MRRMRKIMRMEKPHERIEIVELTVFFVLPFAFSYLLPLYDFIRPYSLK